MTKLRALSDRAAGSTDAAIHIDYARNSLEELTALVQRWQHHFADNAPALQAGGDVFRALRVLEWRAHPVPDLDSGELRGPAAA